jgi:hypothetical protein
MKILNIDGDTALQAAVDKFYELVLVDSWILSSRYFLKDMTIPS